jgi:hypothetical protein
MSDPRDDFGIFAETTHMFFGVDEPFAMLRSELEDMFRQQIASSRINAIKTVGEPKFLTMGHRLEGDEDKVVVTHYGVCFQCSIDVETDDHREPELWCTMTVAFGDLDQPGDERMQAWMDIGGDADAAFEEEAFKGKFLEFRYADA